MEIYWMLDSICATSDETKPENMCTAQKVSLENDKIYGNHFKLMNLYHYVNEINGVCMG